MASNEPSAAEKTKFMSRAVELSKEGSSGGLGTPFGAVIVRHGDIIGESCNLSLVNSDPTAHGEVSAIRKACTAVQSEYLDGCHLYTSCYPCQMCMAAIYWTRISRVYYGTTLEELPAHLSAEMKTMKEDMDKPMEERTMKIERIPDHAEAARRVGAEWVPKN